MPPNCVTPNRYSDFGVDLYRHFECYAARQGGCAPSSITVPISALPLAQFFCLFFLLARSTAKSASESPKLAPLRPFCPLCLSLSASGLCSQCRHMVESHLEIGLGFGALLFGTCITVVQARVLRRCARARTWSQTQGKVLHSMVLRDAYGGDRFLHWSPVVSYEYVVNGILYTGRRISLSGYGVDNTPSGATEQVERHYAPGTTVTVWYDPAHPADAVLIRMAGRDIWQLAYFGAALVLIGLLLLAIGVITHP